MWRWFCYQPEDARAAEARLDRLAAEGQELEAVVFCAARFRPAAGRAAECQVEPTRWPGDEKKRGAYLTQRAEAGWTLAAEAGGLWYFKAAPGACPARARHGGGLEWETLWKKQLRSRGWELLATGGLWIAALAWQDGVQKVRLWELCFSNAGLAAGACLLVLLAITLLRGVYLLAYRRRCRRAAEVEEDIPVPGPRGALLRGSLRLVCPILWGLTLLALLLGTAQARDSTDYDGGEICRTERSIVAGRAEWITIHEGQVERLEYFDCPVPWLARWAQRDLVAAEAGEKIRQTHLHGPVVLEPVALGFDSAWLGVSGSFQCLVLRRGGQVVLAEGTGLDFRDPDTLSALWEQIELGA